MVLLRKALFLFDVGYHKTHVSLLKRLHIKKEEHQKIIKWAQKGHRVVVADVTFTMKTVSDETLMAVTRIIERAVATCCLSMAMVSLTTAKIR